MIKLDEDALICDFAETYQIYDFRSHPLRRIATFACGLRDNSRIKMKINGLKMPIETMLLAGSFDKLAYILWTKTEDAVKGINQPASILNILTGKEQEKKVMAFESIEEFEKYRNSFFE